MEGMLDLAGEDCPHRRQRPARDRRGRLVHAGEGRIVPEGTDPGRRRPIRVGGEPPNDREVRRIVAECQVLVGCGLGRQTGTRPDRAQEIDRRPEPERRQRVTRPEVVRQRARTVDEEWTGAGQEPSLAGVAGAAGSAAVAGAAGSAAVAGAAGRAGVAGAAGSAGVAIGEVATGGDPTR